MPNCETTQPRNCGRRIKLRYTRSRRRGADAFDWTAGDDFLTAYDTPLPGLLDAPKLTVMTETASGVEARAVMSQPEGARASGYRRCIDAFNCGDVAEAALFADDNVVIYEVTSLPWGGTYHGAEGFRRLVLNLASQFYEARLDIEHLIEFEPNGLFIIARMIGRAKSTMAPIDEYYHEVMHFDGDDPARFTQARICFADDVRLLRAFGHDRFPDQTLAAPMPVV